MVDLGSSIVFKKSPGVKAPASFPMGQAHLDQLPVDGADPVAKGQVHREEAAEGDQRDEKHQRQ